MNAPITCSSLTLKRWEHRKPFLQFLCTNCLSLRSLGTHIVTNEMFIDRSKSMCDIEARSISNRNQHKIWPLPVVKICQFLQQIINLSLNQLILPEVKAYHVLHQFHRSKKTDGLRYLFPGNQKLEWRKWSSVRVNLNFLIPNNVAWI